MRTEKFELKDVKVNPFQTRLSEDPQHIEKLMDSIRQEGLLQMPVGRRTDDGGIELAFGMSRLAAFRKLEKEKGGERFKTIPVDVRKITDQMMFELAVRENNDRKDLSPMETAIAMGEYMNEFEATKAEVGELFGMQPGSVVNKMNLLKLPEEVAALVHSGELQERSARMMLHLGHINPSHASLVAKKIVEGEETDWETITEHIANAMRMEAVELAARWNNNQAFGKWWMLDDEFQTGREVPQAILKGALDMISPDGFELTVENEEGEVEIRAFKTGEVASLIRKGWDASQTARDMIELYKYPEDAVMLADHLKNPPKCTACEYHSVIRETHFCAMKPCVSVKKRATTMKERSAITRRKTTKGVKFYDAKEDGKSPLKYSNYGWGPGAEVQKKMFLKAVEDKHPDLRVKMHAPDGYIDEYTGSGYADFVIVGKLKEKIIKKGQKADDEGRAEHSERDVNYEVLNIQRQQIVRAAAGPLSDRFGKFKGDDLRVIVALAAGDSWEEWLKDEPYFNDEAEWKQKEKESKYRYFLARVMIERSLYYGMDVEEIVEHVDALAAKAGVELPKDWSVEALVVVEEEEEVEGEDGEESDEEE